MYPSVQLLSFVHSLDQAMRTDEETHANFRNSETARAEVAIFLAWMRSQAELTPEEKDKLARLADRYQKGRGR